MARRGWIAFGVALIAITIARVLAVDALADRSFFIKYLEFADALRAGQIVRDRIPDLSPGYLWTVALLRAIGLGVHGIRTLQIVLLSGVAAIAARIAFRLQGSAAAIAASLLILGSKAALVNATDLEPETFLLFFSSLGLMLMMNGRPSMLFASGLAFGAAAAFRPVALLAALALFIWLIVEASGAAASQAAGGLRARRPSLFLAGLVVPVMVVLLANRAMTGSMLLMDPGTVFYEGMNPNATGYEGVAPRIVKDIEPSIPGSDTMHVAYRIVASRALGHSLSREEANRYWSQKAMSFATAYPGRAITLVLRKMRLLVSAYDAYDVPSMELKSRAIGGLWISWALLVPLAIAGMRARRDLMPILIYTVCAAVSPVAFFVTARHRNPLLISLAILGGVAVATRWRSIIAIAFMVLVAIALSIPGDLQREDDYLWTATFETGRAMAANDPATAATWLPESVPPSPPGVLHAVALRELSRASSPSRSFSIAIALLQSGDAATADQILERLQSIDFHPFRRTRGVSSIAYYRARAMLRLGRDAVPQIARARVEAPGDAEVLALSTVVERNPAFARQLDALHDPITRERALARARDAVRR